IVAAFLFVGIFSTLLFFLIQIGESSGVPDISLRAERITNEQNQIGDYIRYNIVVSGEISRANPLDISFQSSLTDKTGNTIAEKSSRRMVSGNIDFQEELLVPSEAVQGEYSIRIRADYHGKSASTSIPVSLSSRSDVTESDSGSNETGSNEASPQTRDGIDIINLDNTSDDVFMEYEGNATVTSTHNSKHISTDKMAKLVLENNPSFSFYLCGKLPMDGSRKRCLEGIDLDYETLGQTDYCEDVYVFNDDQLVCLPKGNVTTGSCNYIMDEEANRDCLMLVAEYEGMVDIVRDLLDELISGNPDAFKILVPYRAPGESIDDYI
ncbi:MAG: hypothetical protein ACOCUR_01810, partial [Nanoarchaeota archaeon]